MKNKLFQLLIIALCWSGAYAQNKPAAMKNTPPAATIGSKMAAGGDAFIVTKHGERKAVKSDDFTIDLHLNEIRFGVAGTNKNSTVNFRQIDSAMLGDYHMKRLILKDGKENKETVCFIVAISENKMLVGNTIDRDPVHMDLPDPKIDVVREIKFRYFITDKDLNIIETLEFNDTTGEKSAAARKNAEEKIKKHFKDCPGLIARLAAYDPKNTSIDYSNASKGTKKSAEKYERNATDITYFFYNPVFAECNPPAEKEVIGDEAAIPNQNYTYGAITAYYQGNAIDTSLKGTFSIKDGYLYQEHKGVKAKYKIKAYKDGVMTCTGENGAGIYTFKIIPETGKNSGFKYDTKIVYIIGQIGSDTAGIYYCIKG